MPVTGDVTIVSWTQLPLLGSGMVVLQDNRLSVTRLSKVVLEECPLLFFITS